MGSPTAPPRTRTVRNDRNFSVERRVSSTFDSARSVCTSVGARNDAGTAQHRKPHASPTDCGVVWATLASPHGPRDRRSLAARLAGRSRLTLPSRGLLWPRFRGAPTVASRTGQARETARPAVENQTATVRLRDPLTGRPPAKVEPRRQPLPVHPSFPVERRASRAGSGGCVRGRRGPCWPRRGRTRAWRRRRPRP